MCERARARKACKRCERERFERCEREAEMRGPSRSETRRHQEDQRDAVRVVSPDTSNLTEGRDESVCVCVCVCVRGRDRLR